MLLAGLFEAGAGCRCAWAQAAREQRVLLERTEQAAVAMAEKLQGVLQRHEASVAALGNDMHRQVACWLSSMSQIQAVQGKVLVRSLIDVVATCGVCATVQTVRRDRMGVCSWMLAT